MTQFFVSGIMETLGDKFGLNIGCDWDDDSDLCYGVVVTSQQTVTQFLTKHRSLYNYLILDDIVDGSSMIRLVRRAVNADLEIDVVINQKDCIPRTTDQPAILYHRTDPVSLPRSVELQYVSFDRGYATNTQYATNEGARVQQAVLSLQCDFILDDATARALAYDTLYRMWQQGLTVAFEHPDLRIEPSDIVQIVTDQGTFVIQILSSLITKEPMDQSGIGRTNQLTGQLLRTRKGVSIAPGQVNSSSSTGVFHTYITPTIDFVGST